MPFARRSGCRPRDEAHHCYEERPQGSAEELSDAGAKGEAKENKEAARLWINGIKALKRVYDLSATPLFVAGSGHSRTRSTSAKVISSVRRS
jgi:hypothetical protein